MRPTGAERARQPMRAASLDPRAGCNGPTVVSANTPIDLVGVIGAGFMGTGIAESVAAAGIHVVVRDVDEAALEAARERIEHSVQRAV
ncbi:MAG: 3-hydroxyacyl-CoA dehydrogenase NAD-binding domain-containing protein, partial [Solirubrobacterales bacterium]